MDDAPPVRLPELVAVHVRDVAHVAAGAHRTPVIGGVSHVAGGPDQLRMGVADVEPGDRATLEVLQEGPAGQRVVGVLAHGATVQALPPRHPRVLGPTNVAPIYRSDISCYTVEPPAEPHTPSRLEPHPNPDPTEARCWISPSWDC